jgi:hypothetical protein
MTVKSWSYGVDKIRKCLNIIGKLCEAGHRYPEQTLLQKMITFQGGVRRESNLWTDDTTVYYRNRMVDGAPGERMSCQEIEHFKKTHQVKEYDVWRTDKGDGYLIIDPSFSGTGPLLATTVRSDDSVCLCTALWHSPEHLFDGERFGNPPLYKCVGTGDVFLRMLPLANPK